MFDDYLARWELVPDGELIFIRVARLLPVRRRGEAVLFANPDRRTLPRPLRFSPNAFGVGSRSWLATRGWSASGLLGWIAAYTGLPAAWLIVDGEEPRIDLGVLELAIAESAQPRQRPVGAAPERKAR